MRVYTAESLTDSFEVTFPLELSQFVELVNTIEFELGYRDLDSEIIDAYDLRLEARVKVAGNTGYEPLDETFIQSMNIRKTPTTLTWDDGLYLSERESIGGFSYKQQGQFSYTIQLQENSLYTSPTITSTTYQPPATIAQPQADFVFLRITDVMQASFAYQFRCDRPVRNLGEEVTTTAVLELPDVWQKTFTLVPATNKTGDFQVDFSVDVGSLNTYLSEISQETGKGSQEYELTLIAEVHTTGETDYGVIDEVFTQTLEGAMTPTSITWSKGLGLTSTKPGAITSKQALPNPDKVFWLTVTEARILFLSTLGIFTAGIIFYVVDYLRHRKPVRRPSELDREVQRIRRKCKGFISEVKELPEVQDAVLISLDSPESLITTAQGLLKPILHHTEAGQHIYSVIDGTTRYRYLLADES